MSSRWRVGSLGFLSLLPLAAHCGSSANGASASTVDGGASSPGESCGTRSSMRGKTSRSVMVGGAGRTYIVYLPKSLDATTAAPFVYVFHGAEMNASEMYDITQYAALADREGIAVAFLDGQATSSTAGTMTLDPWNVSDNGAAVCSAGNYANNPKANVDFDFMDAVKADVLQDQCLDGAHVFATGFSMGGYFSHHIGCDRSDIRAVAPGSGGTLASLSSCKTDHKPVIIFHGTSDPLIAPGCDDPNSPAQSGFTPSATLWAQKNGCKTTYSTVPMDGDGGGNGQCYLYDGCPADGQVKLCTFTGMSHCWAGGGGGSMFACATYASATELEWDFFKKYAW